MKQELIDYVKKEFRIWSFWGAPTSEHEITVFIDYVLDHAIDPEDARQILTEWMDDDEEVPPPYGLVGIRIPPK